MKNLLILFLLSFITLNAYAQFASAPAFPGAEGFGRYTTGGRGGTVYHVTSLDDYIDDSKYGSKTPSSEIKSKYTGTLRYAINQSGARTIVFDIAGTIALKCPLKIQKNDISILGQTAPGNGICLKNYTLQLRANNIIVRFIRCRMGDECKSEDDAMNSTFKDGDEKRNIIVDHCSMSWSTDECGSFYGNIDFTLQWCILSESLRNSVHDKGKHGYGGIWGGKNASFHHNLLAHHDSRNPRFDHGYLSTLTGPVDYINNVVYNWGGNSSYGGENCSGCQPKQHNLIGNYYKPGPYTNDSTSHSNRLLNPTTKCSNCNKADPIDVVPGKFYFENNIVNWKNAEVSKTFIAFDQGYSIDKFKENCVLDSRALSSDQDFSQYAVISIQDAKDAYEKVVRFSGASLKRDAVDISVCDDVKNGTAKNKGNKFQTPGLIDTQDDVKGKRESAWPELQGTALLDSDNDGIPDEWETENGLDPNDASDGNAFTLDPKQYYTNLEVYANSLVEGIVRMQRQESKSGNTFEEYYPVIKTPISMPDDETSIIRINEKDSAETESFYSIDGRLVAPTHRGIKIQKGQKIYF